jgi:hypothetical protein
MANVEIANQVAEDDTPLGEPLTVSELPDEFGDLSSMNDFYFLSDDDTPAGEEKAEDAPSGTAAAAPADAPPPAEEPAALPNPQATEKLEAYERLDAALRENPGQAIRAIFAGMDPRDRTALATELASTQAPSREAAEPFDVKQYEPQGEMEEALRSRWDSIEAIPAIIEAQNFTDKRMEQGFAAFVPHVTDANIAAQIALAKVEAVCEALGLELPDPDGQVIVRTLQGGKSTYRDAVRASASYKGQVDAHKQTRRPRPETPGGGPRGIEKIAAGTDAVAIARRLGVLPPR